MPNSSSGSLPRFVVSKLEEAINEARRMASVAPTVDFDDPMDHCLDGPPIEPRVGRKKREVCSDSTEAEGYAIVAKNKALKHLKPWDDSGAIGKQRIVHDGTVSDIDEYRPHETGWAQCVKCGYRWVAVVPVDRLKGDLECPRHCGMTGKFPALPECVQTQNIHGYPLPAPCREITFSGKHDREGCSNAWAGCLHHVPLSASESAPEGV